MSALVMNLPVMPMDAFRAADLESPWSERLAVVGIVALALLAGFGLAALRAVLALAVGARLAAVGGGPAAGVAASAAIGAG